MRNGGLLAGALALAATGVPGLAATPGTVVRTCHGGLRSIPVGPARNDKDCPAGCHAACLRKAGDDDEPGDQL